MRIGPTQTGEDGGGADAAMLIFGSKRKQAGRPEITTVEAQV
jgi:hypothetical protein